MSGPRGHMSNVLDLTPHRQRQSKNIFLCYFYYWLGKGPCKLDYFLLSKLHLSSLLIFVSPIQGSEISLYPASSPIKQGHSNSQTHKAVLRNKEDLIHRKVKVREWNSEPNHFLSIKYWHLSQSIQSQDTKYLYYNKLLKWCLTNSHDTLGSTRNLP